MTESYNEILHSNENEQINVTYNREKSQKIPPQNKIKYNHKNST